MTGPIKGNAKLMIIHKVADNQAPELAIPKWRFPQRIPVLVLKGQQGKRGKSRVLGFDSKKYFRQ